MQNRLAANQRCPEQFEALIGQVKKLHHDFQEFEKECESKSEVCTFFGVWLQLVAIIKNAVASERDGNWNMHAATLKILCQSLKNLTALTTYVMVRGILNKSRFTHPELYRRFSMGLWVVQHRPGWLCAVGGDMKVEQTIQRVSKGHGGHYVVWGHT